MIKKTIKKITPHFAITVYHYILGFLFALIYGNPSKYMYVIGVTGTSGKSTTIHFLRSLLEHGGFVVGSLSTVDFYVAGKKQMNDQKMTMLGRGKIQKYMSKMVKAGCQIAIIETTSEGYLQHRHKFINYDAALLTNLYPEHIEAHGGFENYKEAKLGIFRYISNCRTKQALPEEQKSKVCFVNTNNEHSLDFIKFRFDKKCCFGREDQPQFVSQDCKSYLARDVVINQAGLEFVVNNKKMTSPLLGEHNIHNFAAAIAVARHLKIKWKRIEQAISELGFVPGRIEFIKEAQKHKVKVIVDYAFEPVALEKLYEAISVLDYGKIIHVCGSTGGGRDKARRPKIGRIAAKNADIVIVTNEDPYDEDPMQIIDQVAAGSKKAGKKIEKDLFIIEDRGKAIEKAIAVAKSGDIVLITGKGSEQAMAVKHGKMIPWDDRDQVKKALKKVYVTKKRKT